MCGFQATAVALFFMVIMKIPERKITMSKLLRENKGTSTKTKQRRDKPQTSMAAAFRSFDGPP